MSSLPPPPQQNQPPSRRGKGPRTVTYSPASANKEPGAWWPPKRWSSNQRAVVFLGAAVVFGGLFFLAAEYAPKEADKPTPTGGTELCALLRDPESRLLTRGDFERLTDFTDYELQRYVAARCPDQLDRVD